jgi:hypothetical protein
MTFIKDLAMMPVLFRAWRSGQIWLEHKNNELDICMHKQGSSELMMAGMAYKRMSRRIDVCINSFLGTLVVMGAIIVIQYLS